MGRKTDEEIARREVRRLRPGGAGRIAAVEREGLREYYDPRTGKGLGARNFAWSALIAELADPDLAAAHSYL